ncbi:MAG: hypothetical protein HY455_02350 [Parcubacteria group bacterium]|nr:hypothetical protein [Parcubacteria group bacterium]
MEHERLLALLGGEQTFDKASFEQVALSVKDLSTINILPQPRKTFSDEELEALLQSIVHSGLLNPIIVAELQGREHCERYVSVINKLWGTTFEVKSLHSTVRDSKRVWRILVAGERRMRAIKEARRRHLYRDDSVRIAVAKNIDPFHALLLQWQENTHQRVPIHEDARATALLFKLVREADPKLSQAKFGKHIGRSAEMVSHSLRFVDLPPDIQTLTEEGKIPYGVSLELSRLQVFGVAEQDLLSWARRAIVDRLSVEKVHKQVSEYIEHQRSGQQSLMDIFQTEMAEGERIRERELLATNTDRALWIEIKWCQTILTLFEKGMFKPEDSPYLKRRSLRSVLALVDKLEQLNKHLESLLSPALGKRLTEVVAETKKNAEALLARATRE